MNIMAGMGIGVGQICTFFMDTLQVHYLAHIHLKA